MAGYKVTCSAVPSHCPKQIHQPWRARPRHFKYLQGFARRFIIMNGNIEVKDSVSSALRGRSFFFSRVFHNHKTTTEGCTLSLHPIQSQARACFPNQHCASITKSLTSHISHESPPSLRTHMSLTRHTMSISHLKSICTTSK